jgi:chemotaxis protein methyltransferase CheR
MILRSRFNDRDSFLVADLICFYFGLKVLERGLFALQLMNDHQFRQLLNHLGLSWNGYRKVRKGVKKRMARHMQKLACPNMETYLLTLDHNQDAKDESMRLMTVSISRFFRDSRLWETLQAEILPLILQRNPDSVRVWSAGCARGEEIYTFKLVWLTLEKHMGPLPGLSLWATDMHSDSVEKAKKGVYAGSSLKEMPEAMRDRYFRVWKKDKSWQILDAVKTGIRWQVRNLAAPPPDRNFHIVFLRNNLLTYYKDPFKVPAFERVVTGLAKGGYLVIGSHEKIPPGFSVLLPSGLHPCIFEKQGFRF